MDDGDGGVRGGAFLREQQGERPTEGGAAAEDAHLVARHRHVVVREQRLDPGGRARDGAGHRQRQPAHVDRVQAVDVLVGVDREQRGVEVDLGRGRVLHEHRVNRRILVEFADRREQVGLRGVVGQVDVRRVAAQLGGLAHQVQRGRALVLAVSRQSDAGDEAHEDAAFLHFVIPGLRLARIPE